MTTLEQVIAEHYPSGYTCGCGIEINSGRGWGEHVAGAVRAWNAAEARGHHLPNAERAERLRAWSKVTDLRETLHDLWLAIHVQRFDGRDDDTEPDGGRPRAGGPDSFYNGIRHAERAIVDHATYHGIEWRDLIDGPPPSLLPDGSCRALWPHDDHEIPDGRCPGRGPA